MRSFCTSRAMDPAGVRQRSCDWHLFSCSELDLSHLQPQSELKIMSISFGREADTKKRAATQKKVTWSPSGHVTV